MLFLPAEDPRLSILVVLDEPKDHYYGGRVAAPVFQKIATQSLAHLKIFPGKEKQTFQAYGGNPDRREISVDNGGEMEVYSGKDGAVIPDLRGLTLREVLVRMGMSPAKVYGQGVVMEQSPQAGKAIKAGHGYSVRLGVKGLPDNTVSL